MRAKMTASFLIVLFVVGMTIATLCLPKKKYSQSENRALAPFPKISFSAVTSGEFSKSFDSWFTDHFFGRDTWTAVNGGTEYALGKRENKDVFICDNQLMARLPEPNELYVNRSIDAMNSFAKKNQGPSYYAMLIPSASEIQADRLPKNATSTLWSQKDAIDGWYQTLGENGWSTVDAEGALEAHKGEEIYYHTDHHWTSQGAYYGYEELAKDLNIAAVSQSSMDVETVSTDFYGTLYNKAGFRGIQPDQIDYYFPNGGEGVESVTITTASGQETYNSLYFKEYLEKKDQYASFLGENRAYVSIKTTANTGKKILIFKDSYANSLVPFLTSAYDEIDLVDLRYVNDSFTQQFTPTEYDDVLLLYSVDVFSSGNDLSKIDW